MKTTILSGLTAIALGALTSCSNILEDNGINPGAKAETGLLSLNLNTDASVGVMTKAEGTTTPIFDIDKNITQAAVENGLKVTATKDNQPANLGVFNDYKDNNSKLVEVGTYSNIKASYRVEGKDESLDFSNPIFEGSYSGTVTVVANTTTSVNDAINVTLQNSVIQIDPTTFSTLTTQATISELSISVGSVTKSLLKTGVTPIALNDEFLYVKSGVSPTIIIKGTMNDGKSTSININTPLIKNANNEVQNTIAAKHYKVSFNLSDKMGYLSLQITVNGNVTEEQIKVEVNPYPDQTSNNN